MAAFWYDTAAKMSIRYFKVLYVFVCITFTMQLVTAFTSGSGTYESVTDLTATNTVFRETQFVCDAPYMSTLDFSTSNAICEYPENNTACGTVFDRCAVIIIMHPPHHPHPCPRPPTRPIPPVLTLTPTPAGFSIEPEDSFFETEGAPFLGALLFVLYAVGISFIISILAADGGFFPHVLGGEELLAVMHNGSSGSSGRASEPVGVAAEQRFSREPLRKPLFSPSFSSSPSPFIHALHRR